MEEEKPHKKPPSGPKAGFGNIFEGGQVPSLKSTTNKDVGTPKEQTHPLAKRRVRKNQSFKQILSPNTSNIHG